MKKSPLSQVKERFKDKAGLVKAVSALATGDLWVDRLNKDKGLDCVPNSRLLHLHDVLSEVKKSVGSRDKLVDGILKLENRAKDKDYRSGLEKHSTPRLWDRYRTLKRTSKSS